jgi:hypothetical protein
MDYSLLRIKSRGDYTIGGIFEHKTALSKPNFLCFSLEDEFRKEKLKAETRIKFGRYKLELRTEGGLTQKYARKFPGMHVGMIWLRDVPDFKWVYIHVGNTDDDTEGCIVVGNGALSDRLTNSVDAYSFIYPKMVASIRSGPTYITIVDHDDPLGVAA